MRFLLLFLLLMTDIALACEAMTHEQLQAKLKQEMAGQVPASQLVFFASWCASCKKHLVAEQLPSSYFVAIFDEAPAAERAFIAFLGRDALKRCVFDKDGSIAAAYQVKSLPAVRPLSALKD